MELTPDQSRALLNIARSAILSRLQGRDLADFAVPDPALLQPAGCFVSLHSRYNHALRGCVGRMEAVQPLAYAVAETALSVLGDPRFTYRPVTLAELPQLEIEISVLSPLRPAPHPLAFDPLTEGIHLTIDGASGVFLPQVARETGWTREQLLDRLCTEKLNLPPLAWQRPDAQLRVFTSLILGPVRFFE